VAGEWRLYGAVGYGDRQKQYPRAIGPKVALLQADFDLDVAFEQVSEDGYLMVD